MSVTDLFVVSALPTRKGVHTQSDVCVSHSCLERTHLQGIIRLSLVPELRCCLERTHLQGITCFSHVPELCCCLERTDFLARSERLRARLDRRIATFRFDCISKMQLSGAIRTTFWHARKDFGRARTGNLRLSVLIGSTQCNFLARSDRLSGT